MLYPLLSPLFAAAAFADEAHLPVQGMLTDPDGIPIDGQLEAEFALLSDPEGPPEWSERQVVTFTAGGFTTSLGRNVPLGLDVFADFAELWLEVAVDGDRLGVVPLGTVPYAAYAVRADRALDAERFAGKTVEELAIPDAQDVEASARGVCYDTEAELRAVLDDDYHRRGAPISGDQFDAYSDLASQGQLGTGSPNHLLRMRDGDSRYMKQGQRVSYTQVDTYWDLHNEGRLDGNHASDLTTLGRGDKRYHRKGVCAKRYVSLSTCVVPPLPPGYDPPKCDEVASGGLCESDGECGLSVSLNNCFDPFRQGNDDWYYAL